MKSILQLIILAVICAVISPAHAEGRCPDGQYPIGGGNAGWEGCAPMDGATGSSSQPSNNSVTRWANRWGAIAADGNAPAFGVSNDVASKRLAEKKAKAMCEARGGKKCRTSIVFYNQCGALAWGDTNFATFRSPDVDDAKASAVGHCEKSTTNCVVHYSACSNPVLIR
jgi:hypothetical protein